MFIASISNGTHDRFCQLFADRAAYYSDRADYERQSKQTGIQPYEVSILKDSIEALSGYITNIESDIYAILDSLVPAILGAKTDVADLSDDDTVVYFTISDDAQQAIAHYSNVIAQEKSTISSIKRSIDGTGKSHAIVTNQEKRLRLHQRELEAHEKALSDALMKLCDAIREAKPKSDL